MASALALAEELADEGAQGGVGGAARPVAVGLSTAGVVDAARGRITHATASLPGWAGTELTAAFTERLGLPARALNDVHAHGLGEARFGLGREHSSLLLVAVGTGIGGAHVVDGIPLTGARGASGHIGHVSVPEAVGIPCPCGRGGHLEGLARTACRTAGLATGRVLGSLLNVLDVDVIALAGGVVGASPLWREALAEGMARETMGAIAATRVLDALEGTLIVSCQAYPGEPMRDPRTMAQVAAAVQAGGASAVRAQGLGDIRQVRDAVDVPVIGIWKDGEEGVFITPALEHALAVIDAGADVLALDGTLRPRPDGLTLAETVAGIRARSEVPIMADCDSLESALAAADLGIEIIGTTLAGYTDARERTVGPDLALLGELSGRLPTSSVLVAEGRVHSPAQAAAARAAGAFAVVVGTPITHPTMHHRLVPRGRRRGVRAAAA